MHFTDYRTKTIIEAMMTPIECVLMRGGTSRGPYFRREWLPADPAKRDRVLLHALGSPHELQIDGIGGGNSLTSKVAIVSTSRRVDCDVDYLFAQVSPQKETVDTRPNCGNMLSGVGPFAIEEGLVPARDDTTPVRIHNVNTGAIVESIVQTPDRQVTYEGEARIDGVPGTSAPILLSFEGAWGATTGTVFPTGLREELIRGVTATCIDAAIPMMLVRASDLGLTGSEAPCELDQNKELLARLEAMRIEAGQRMGLGDVSNSVIPKPVLISPGRHGFSLTSRYFTPNTCHRAHAVTGAIGVASALALPGTIAHTYADGLTDGNHRISVHHPAGCIDVEIELDTRHEALPIRKASLIRTARKIMRGELYVPSHLL